MSFLTSCEDGERHCQKLCRPIITGLGEVVVRPIGPGDADLVQAFVGSLSATSRYYRFFQPLKVLSPAMLDRFVRVDHRTHLALVGVTSIRGRQNIVGEARYAVSDDGATADVAVAIADPWQRHGIATGLIETLERIATTTGVMRLTGECFAINEAFLSFARALGFRTRPGAADRSFVRVEKDTHGQCQQDRCGG